MTFYVAERDEDNRIAAVWIKERAARSPVIFDPRKHSFDSKSASGFFGASEAEIARWISMREPQDLRFIE